MKRYVRHALLQVAFLSCSALLYASQAKPLIETPAIEEKAIKEEKAEKKESAIVVGATQSLARVIIAVNASDQAPATLDSLADRAKNEVANFVNAIKTHIPEDEREDVKKAAKEEIKQALNTLEDVCKKHYAQIKEHYKKTVNKEAQEKASVDVNHSLKTIKELGQEAGNDQSVKQLGHDLKGAEKPAIAALERLGIHKSDVNAVLRTFKKIKIRI